MFVGVQVDIEGEGWMVRVVDKCYYCIYERDNLLDVIINSPVILWQDLQLIATEPFSSPII